MSEPRVLSEEATLRELGLSDRGLVSNASYSIQGWNLMQIIATIRAAWTAGAQLWEALEQITENLDVLFRMYRGSVQLVEEQAKRIEELETTILKNRVFFGQYKSLGHEICDTKLGSGERVKAIQDLRCLLAQPQEGEDDDGIAGK